MLCSARSLGRALSPWGRALSPGISLYTQAFADYLWYLLESFWLNKMSLSAGEEVPFPNNISNLQQFPDLIIACLEPLWHRIAWPGEHSHHPCAPAPHFLQGSTGSGAESNVPGDGAL